MLLLKKYLNFFSSRNVSAILSLTFIILLTIILLVWINNEQRLLSMQTIIDQNQQAGMKMQLLNGLIETARTRTRVTADVIYEEDPFVQDELGLQLDVLASRFALLRSELMALPVSDREKALLDQQAMIVPVILPAQRRAVELAIDDDEESNIEAQRLLHEVVDPGQNKLVKLFMELIDYQRKNIDELAITSKASYESAHQQNQLLITVVLFIAALLSLVALLRVRNIQRNVIDARDQMEVAVEKRTQELAESQAMLQTVLDTIPTRVFWKDTSGAYLGCNRLFARDAGNKDVSDIIGKSDADLNLDNYTFRYAQEDIEVIETGVSIVDRQEPSMRTDNEAWREITKVPLLNNNNIVGMLGSYNDITEHKRMEGIKDDFVSTVSHELRTPLTSIRGSIGLLLRDAVDEFSPKAARLLELANRNTIRLLALINDLLDMQKMLSGEMICHFKPIDLALTLEKTVDENAHYAEQYNVKYVINECPAVTVSVDEQRIMQVMSNLLSNAAKFSEPDTQVEISLSNEDGYAIVQVTDHGPGIPEEFHDILFERFTQVDSSDTRQKGGTGLGLAISRSIIEQHEGTIGFDTGKGVGSTFYFKLPVIAA